MRHLSPEQVLLIADEFCEQYRVNVIDFAAIFAATSITGGQIAGVTLFQNVNSARQGLERTIIALTPLSDRNREFATVVGEVFRRLNA